MGNLIQRWLARLQGKVFPENSRNKRKGVTAMEYLVAISFILVVLILAIQHIGSITGGMFQKSANSTNFNGSSGS